MFLFLPLFIFHFALNSHKFCAGRAADTQMDSLKEYYKDYRLMNEYELRAELTLVWYTTIGGAYYNLKERIDADCANTSTAAADLWQELVTIEYTTPLIAAALTQAASDVRLVIQQRQPLTHPMELICKRLESSLRSNATLYAKFGQFKRQPQSPGKIESRRHSQGGRQQFQQQQQSTTSRQEMVNTSSLQHVNAFSVFWLGIPRIGLIVTHATFANYVTIAVADNCSDEYRLAKSIVQLAGSDEDQSLRVLAQEMYDQVRRELIRSILETVAEEEQRGEKVQVFKLIRDSLMVKLRQSFDAHPRLGSELKKFVATKNGTNACYHGQVRFRQ